MTVFSNDPSLCVNMLAVSQPGRVTVALSRCGGFAVWVSYMETVKWWNCFHHDVYTL